jgi:hypothetical protein
MAYRNRCYKNMSNQRTHLCVIILFDGPMRRVAIEVYEILLKATHKRVKCTSRICCTITYEYIDYRCLDLSGTLTHNVHNNFIHFVIVTIDVV